MNRSIIVLLTVLMSGTRVLAAEPTAAPISTVTKATSEKQKSELTIFDLDFPGGHPSDLVKAITKASGQPLNVAISSDDDNTVAIPPLRLRGVNVVSVLNAVSGASARSTRVQVSGNAYDYRQTGYRFTPFGGEPVTPSTVWYFQRQNPLETEKVCRFYQLSP